MALRDREEQRHAKEQAREEARARKEQERALREAAKEEETLRKAMEQAREQFEHASGAQRAMYEERLRDMDARLIQATRKKGTSSLDGGADRRKGTFISFRILVPSAKTFSRSASRRRDDPFDRIRELGDSSVPFEYDVHAMILSDDAPALELMLHKHFLLRQINKVNPRKEFFRATLAEIREEIEKARIDHWREVDDGSGGARISGKPGN